MGQIAMDGLGLSELAPRVVQSEIRAMTAECDRMGGVNLAQGVCDTEVPSVVMEGAMRAMREGHNIYTRMDGIARLRRAIAEKLERTHGLRYDPEREVMVASGATGAFHAAAMALLNPGDEVLLFEPFYGYHVSTSRIDAGHGCCVVPWLSRTGRWIWALCGRRLLRGLGRWW